MANFFKVTNNKKPTNQNLTVDISRLDHQGCGVGYHQKKAIFVEGALPGEQVEIKLTEQKNKFSRGKLIRVVSPSLHRIDAKCQHFKHCGGCNLQHFHIQEQLNFKQDKLEQLFSRNNLTGSLPWQSALIGKHWHYRRKARIGVQYNKNGVATIGFRQQESNQLVAINNCPVLVTSCHHLFDELKLLLAKLSGKNPIGHIEVICANVNVLIVRQLVKMTTADRNHWQIFAEKNDWQIYIDDGESVTPLNIATELYYPLEQDINIYFKTSNFIQVNHDINLKMISQALAWLRLDSDDCVLDLFCGLGNFSLPIARQAKTVVGIEGVDAMVAQAHKNAELNGIANCQFYQADLNSDWQTFAWAQQTYNKVLLDPARAGAFQALEQVMKLEIATILYVSCDPTSLAKDAELLVKHGYKIKKIAIMDMFSQTKHIETMVMFTR